MSNNLSIIENIIFEKSNGKIIDSEKLLELLHQSCWRLFPPSKEKRNEALMALMLIKVAWYHFQSNAEIQYLIESDFYKFHLDISKCAPDLIGNINYNADQDRNEISGDEFDILNNEIIPNILKEKENKKVNLLLNLINVELLRILLRMKNILKENRFITTPTIRIPIFPRTGIAYQFQVLYLDKDKKLIKIKNLDGFKYE